MNKLAASLLALSLVGPDTAAHAQDHSDMLESVIPSVVTVGVVTEDGATAAFGFGEEAQRAAETAYEAPLHLQGMNSTGSGFVVDRGRRRFIVTNAHVIAKGDPDRIYVFSHERKRYSARLVGADTHWDVAILEVDPAATSELRPIDIRTTPIRVGTTVFAIGNPQGIRPYTITRGIVSGLNRATGAAQDGYLQHDAGIVYGNSGGPLIDVDGRVLGINTAIGTHQSTPLTYIGLALAGDRLQGVVSDLIATGRVRRPYLGLHVISRHLPEGGTGIVLRDTIPGSPAAAARAPIERDPGAGGWQIVEVNGEPVLEIAEITAALELISPTAPVRLGLQKGDSTRTLTIRPRALDDELLAAIGSWVLRDRLGITVTSDLSILSAPGTPPQKWMVYEPSSNGLRTVDNAPALAPRRGDDIVQAGIVQSNAFQLFRATSLKDIGVISRMVMPDAWLSLVLTDGDSTRVVSTVVFKSTVL